jgi:xanthine dehydrogenase accessory factor
MALPGAGLECHFGDLIWNNTGMNVRLDTSFELLLERAPVAHASRVLATVVKTAGSTYRKPGARMLLMADGSYLGLLSGGCLESDLQIHAREVLDSGVARAVEYDTRGPDDTLFGVGAGCEGTMRVLLEPAGPGSTVEAALQAVGRLTHAGETTSLVMVHTSAQVRLGTYPDGEALPPAERERAYIQRLAPPPHLLICGAAPDAQPVVSAARALGWRVSVIDHRPAYAVAARFAGAEVRVANPKSLRGEVDLARCHAAVVMSHHLPSDEAYLRELAQAGVPAYVGLLGPKARRSRLAKELGPLTDNLGTRIRGPVGLDIGAATPESIALAIIAQIHAWLAGRAYSEAVLT